MPKPVNTGLLGMYICKAIGEARDIFADFNPSQEKFDELDRRLKIAKLCLDLIEDGESQFSWMVLAKNGQLCKRDFEYFRRELTEAGIGTYEEYSEAYNSRVKSNV